MHLVCNYLLLTCSVSVAFFWHSDGNDHPCFDGLVTVPPQWDKGRNEKVLPKRKKKKKEKESSIAATASPKATPTKRIWDFESSQFVELITIED